MPSAATATGMSYGIPTEFEASQRWTAVSWVIRRSTHRASRLAPVQVHTSWCGGAPANAENNDVCAAITQSTRNVSDGRGVSSHVCNTSTDVTPSATTRPQKFQTPPRCQVRSREVPSRTRRHRPVEPVVGHDLEESDRVGAQMGNGVVREWPRGGDGVGHGGDGTPAVGGRPRRAIVRAT